MADTGVLAPGTLVEVLEGKHAGGFARVESTNQYGVVFMRPVTPDGTIWYRTAKQLRVVAE